MNILNSVIEVEKRSLSKATITKLEADLTRKNPEYAQASRFGNKFSLSKIPKELRFFKDTGKEYIIPRNYFSNKDLSIEYNINTVKGTVVDFTSDIELRDYQQPYLKQVWKYLRYNPQHGDVILEVPCGHGKTVMALELVCRLKSKFIVLVPTNYLRRQWTRSIKRFTNAGVFSPTSTTKDLQEKLSSAECVVITLDLFNARKHLFTKEILDSFGSVVLDESHKVGAPTYIPIIESFRGANRIALSATFRRSDSMQVILSYHFGKVFSMPLQFDKARLYYLNTPIGFNTVSNYYSKYLKNKWPLEKLVATLSPMGFSDFDLQGEYLCFDSPPTKTLDLLLKDSTIHKDLLRFINDARVKSFDPSFSLIESYLSMNKQRTRITRNILNSLFESGRTVLVLSKRKDQLKHLHKIFKDKVPSSLFVGGEIEEDSPEESFMIEHARFIFGIDKLAQEGFDIPRIDTLLMLTPIKDCEQAIGRILRVLEGKKYSLALMMVDQVDFCRGMAKASEQYFKNNAEYSGTLQNVTELKQLLNGNLD